MIFISRSEKNRLTEILAALQGSRALTVGETDRFLQRGGMLNLVLVENSVRFEVNLPAAERAGLKLSSRLLGVAKTVLQEGAK